MQLKRFLTAQDSTWKYRVCTRGIEGLEATFNGCLETPSTPIYMEYEEQTAPMVLCAFYCEVLTL